VDQFLSIARDDHAIMVAAEVGHVPARFERVLPKREDSRLQPLKPAEDGEDNRVLIGYFMVGGLPEK
jgi:hypothetical protein